MSNRSWTPLRRPTRTDQPELLHALAPGIDGQGDWRDRALCAETDPDAFFRRACEVRSECLQDAVDRGEPFGI